MTCEKGSRFSLFGRFLNRSIRTQYVTAAVLLSIALLVSAVYIACRVYAISYQERLQGAQGDFESSYIALDKFEKRMLHLASLVQSNTATVGLLSQSSAFSYAEYLRANQGLLPLLYTLSDGSDDYFCRLYVDYSLNRVDRSSRILLLDDIVEESWAQEAMAGWGWWRFYSGTALNASQPALLAPIRSLTDNTRLVALFRVDISVATLEQMLAAPQAGAYTTCYLEDAAGNNVALCGLPLEAEISSERFAPFNSFVAMDLNTFLSGKDTVFYRQLSSSRWRLTMVVHHRSLFNILFPQFCLLTLSGFALMLLGVMCAFPILARTVARIHRFSSHVQRYNEAEGHLHSTPPRLTPDARDEIGCLIAAHNAMLDRIDTLIQEKQSQEQEMRRLEINALQSQIKPHFLYNTLEAIIWMARLNQTDKVESTVRSLTRFYRLCLGKGHDVLTLGQELEIVRNYFAIQCTRYEQTFSLIVDVAQSLLFVPLPKITLQPLVENALVHGILESGHNTGEIRIFTRLSSDGLYELCIADSGAHFSPDDFVRALNQSTNENVENAGEGYGLKNIERRLCLYFKKPQTLFLDTSDPAFTCIVLPLFIVQSDQ